MKQPLSNHEHEHQRQVYLLTCWREMDDQTQIINWQFKLETPGPNQWRLFNTLGEVMKAIEMELHRIEPAS